MRDQLLSLTWGDLRQGDDDGRVQQLAQALGMLVHLLGCQWLTPTASRSPSSVFRPLQQSSP
jgi:hypothetical protein